MQTKQFYAMILACLIVAGCGGQGFVPAGGKVAFDDGTPLEGGGITFQTETFMAQGEIRSDGTFTLSSLKPGDGLPPGTYKVVIGWSDYDANERIVHHVDPIFADPMTTTLTAEVVKGGKGQNQFEFVVTKPR